MSTPRPTVEHYVSPEPFDPHSIERLTPEQERYYLASQWKLMWWKLKRHRLAIVAGVILLLFYGSTLFTEVVAPYNLQVRALRRANRTLGGGWIE